MVRLAKSLLRILLVVGAIIFLLWLAIARPALTDSNTDETPSFINPEDLKQRVIFLSQNAIPRNSENPNNLNAVAEYIRTQIEQYSSSVSYQTYQAGNTEFKNVIAEFGPNTTDVIVIGAHYDAFGEHPAADDNASGVAGLIELGKLLQGVNLKHKVQLVAYTLEEPPYFDSEFMGSFVHAASLRKNNLNVKLMISLEMIGYFSTQPNSQTFPIPLLNLFYPNTGNFIAVVDRLQDHQAAPLKAAINKYTNLAAYSINAPSQITGIDFSDHRNYWFHDYPAVMVTDTSFYRNSHYHHTSDTYEKLDYAQMARVVYGVFKYIQMLDKQ